MSVMSDLGVFCGGNSEFTTSGANFERAKKKVEYDVKAGDCLLTTDGSISLGILAGSFYRESMSDHARRILILARDIHG